jgi:predicted small metal-binding protein
MSIRLECPCGELILAESEDELVDNANAHLETEHPDLTGEYTRDQILFMAITY